MRKETREKKTTFLLTRERSRWDGGSRGKEAAGKKAAPRFFFGAFTSQPDYFAKRTASDAGSMDSNCR